MSETKTFYMVRHGKSSWSDDALSDIDRPLKNRGIEDAKVMANRFRNNESIPHRVISSPALRALHTARIFCGILEIPEDKIIISEDLYNASPSAILRVIEKVPKDVASIMIFGHNPGFTDLANMLSNLIIDNIPTCGLLKLVFNADSWNNIGRRTVVREKFDYPAKV